MADIEPQSPDDPQAPESTPAPVPIQGELLPPFEAERPGFSLEVRQGPLPAPEDFREYAAMIPNGGERLMRMAEKQQEMIEKQQDYSYQRGMKQEGRATFGVVSAILSVASAVGLSGYGFYTGHPSEALGVFGITLGAIVAVFVRGTATQEGQQTQPPQAEGEEE